VASEPYVGGGPILQFDREPPTELPLSFRKSCAADLGSREFVTATKKYLDDNARATDSHLFESVGDPNAASHYGTAPDDVFLFSQVGVSLQCLAAVKVWSINEDQLYCDVGRQPGTVISADQDSRHQAAPLIEVRFVVRWGIEMKQVQPRQVVHYELLGCGDAF